MKLPSGKYPAEKLPWNFLSLENPNNEDCPIRTPHPPTPPPRLVEIPPVIIALQKIRKQTIFKT